jgi:branched-chain amino acid transport system substrate-binding protein
MNGKPALDPANASTFLYADYGNAANPTVDPLVYSQTVDKVLALQPNIVIPIGTNEAIANILGPTEQQWPSGVKRPLWVLPHTGLTSALPQQIKTTDPAGTLQKRVLGVTYGSITNTFTQFAGEFAATQSGGVSPYSLDASNAYDAFFTLLFATVANGSAPLTGTNLSTSIGKLLPPGTPVNIGSAELNNALTLLSQGQNININGASGPLDFDLSTGDVKEDNQVWCVPATGSGPGFPTFSGYGFDLNQVPFGTIDAVVSKCGVTFAP